MMTIKINIKSYFAEYLFGKYNAGSPGVIKVPATHDLYILIYDLILPRPKDAELQNGNIEIVLPHRGRGKSPERFNYISKRGNDIINRKVKAMFWAELHNIVQHEKHIKGKSYISAAYLFIEKYQISTISADGLLKNYYRWRKYCRKNLKSEKK